METTSLSCVSTMKHRCCRARGDGSWLRHCCQTHRCGSGHGAHWGTRLGRRYRTARSPSGDPRSPGRRRSGLYVKAAEFLSAMIAKGETTAPGISKEYKFNSLYNDVTLVNLLKDSDVGDLAAEQHKHTLLVCSYSRRAKPVAVLRVLFLGSVVKPAMTTVGSSQHTTGPMIQDELRGVACLGFSGCRPRYAVLSPYCSLS